MNKRKLITVLLALCLTACGNGKPLHEAAMAGDVAQIRILLNQGADVNAKASDRCKPGRLCPNGHGAHRTFDSAFRGDHQDPTAAGGTHLTSCKP